MIYREDKENSYDIMDLEVHHLQHLLRDFSMFSLFSYSSPSLPCYSCVNKGFFFSLNLLKMGKIKTPFEVKPRVILASLLIKRVFLLVVVYLFILIYFKLEFKQNVTLD